MIIHPQNISASRVYSRIVSLVPSQTELLSDLGLEEEVLAITKFCVHPEIWFKTKKRIGGTKNVKIDIIRELNPDLIIANKEENIKAQVEELSKTVDVFVTDVNNLGEALQMIQNIGILTGTSSTAVDMARAIEIQFSHLHALSAAKRKIKTAYLIWKDPYMVARGNTFINDMMCYCGLENIFEHPDRYPEIKIEDLQSCNTIQKGCELVILSSEPYPFKEKHIQEMQEKLPGVNIILADGEMFSWYGSRLLQSSIYFENFQKKIEVIK